MQCLQNSCKKRKCRQPTATANNEIDVAATNSLLVKAVDSSVQWIRCNKNVVAFVQGNTCGVGFYEFQSMYYLFVVLAKLQLISVSVACATCLQKSGRVASIQLHRMKRLPRRPMICCQSLQTTHQTAAQLIRYTKKWCVFNRFQRSWHLNPPTAASSCMSLKHKYRSGARD